jgi:hypothetical protein
MPEYHCPDCGRTWSENYCPECHRTIERPAAAPPPLLAGFSRTPQERKRASEEFLKQRGVPINPDLPIYESEAQVRAATPEQVAWRACVVSGLVGRALGASRKATSAYFESQGLFAHASAREAAAVRAWWWNAKEKNERGCQVEGLGELAWVLCLIPRPDHFQFCPGNLVNFLPRAHEPVRPFVQRAQMRPIGELLDEADLLYRMHWAARDAWLTGQDPPNGLPYYVTEERFRAINWVLESDVTWEETDTST